jgi:glycosyltransferase involved in cell wall biosynthesis
MLDATVIICSHNPRPHYFSRVLEALRNQDIPRDQWELLLVDNASQPALAARWNLSWHPLARHVGESELGLAAARRRGMTEAAADLLIFVDDDNVLAEDYVSKALKIKEEWPMLGTWGAGSIAPEFERQPAGHLKPYLPSLALRDNKKAYWTNVISWGPATPVGAGLCVRASVADEYCRLRSKEVIRVSDRTGTALLGHGDMEIACVGCSLGLGMGVFPELRMTHLIPKERVSDDYFLRLHEGNEISSGLLGYKWLGEMPPNPLSIRNILSVVKNMIFNQGFDRRRHLAVARGRIAARQAIGKYKGTQT